MTLTNPPPEVEGFESEPLEAAVMGAAHERHREPPEGVAALLQQVELTDEISMCT